MDETQQPKKASHATDPLKQEFKAPMWVFLCFIAYAASGGAWFGATMPDAHADRWLFLGAAVFFLALPVVHLMVKKLRRSKLARDGAAVSPVIGVILMVAITVVLAAVVLAVVSTMAGKGTEQPPSITMNGEDYGQRWVVIRADHGLLWADFTVTGCTTVPTGTLDAGDVLEGCTPPVTIAHTATNAVVFRSGAA